MARLRLVAVLLPLMVSAAVAQAPADREVLFQVSTLGALIQGLYDGCISIGDLRQHGDFGIGTFHRLDGEMLIEQGVCYQLRSDGTCHVAPRSARSPFAAVTFFDPDRTAELAEVASLSALDAALAEALPSPNLICAVRITGLFAELKLRSVPRQQRPYPLLTEVVRTQPVFEHREVHGTLVGYRLPAFVEGLNMPGWHFHFLDATRRIGGHVLECHVRRGRAEVDVTPRLLLSVPTSQAFLDVDLSAHSASDVQRVEK